MKEEDAWVSKDLIRLRSRSCLESMQSAESPFECSCLLIETPAMQSFRPGLLDEAVATA